jgi:hypothetical protein
MVNSAPMGSDRLPDVAIDRRYCLRPQFRGLFSDAARSSTSVPELAGLPDDVRERVCHNLVRIEEPVLVADLFRDHSTPGPKSFLDAEAGARALAVVHELVAAGYLQVDPPMN